MFGVGGGAREFECGDALFGGGGDEARVLDELVRLDGWGDTGECEVGRWVMG